MCFQNRASFSMLQFRQRPSKCEPDSYDTVSQDREHRVCELSCLNMTCWNMEVKPSLGRIPTEAERHSWCLCLAVAGSWVVIKALSRRWPQ